MLSPALGPAQKPTRRIMLMKGLHYQFRHVAIHPTICCTLRNTNVP